jgi:hypothetical protein
MRFGWAIAVVVIVLAAATLMWRRNELFKQYEYEEEVFLSLDGTATVYVNASIPALDALRGATLDPAPNARIDREAIRRFFTTPVTTVTRLNATRRQGRRFVHVRLDVEDVTRLGEAAPFAWSSYRFGEEKGRFVYRQTVGAAAASDVGQVNWTGQELVAFRLHLPSAIIEHNAGEENHKRGNILVWEQLMTDRLKSRPVDLVAQIETESILSHTLWLFGGTMAGVSVAFGLVVLWIARRGPSPSVEPGGRVSPRAGG